jgi:methionine synthase I (cobalamin-dependent)
MGTELLRRGHPVPLEPLNLTAPDEVRAVHAAYREAGTALLTTNSFGANRFRLGPDADTSRLAAINRAAAELARDEARGALVAGSIGPGGQYRDRPSPEEMRHAFAEQASALHQGGIDLFWCETFGDVDELSAAVLGIRDVSSRPIVALMTYTAAGRTPTGLTPAAVVAAVADLPLAAIGVNCALGAGTVERVIRALHGETDLPLVAQPNAGQPIVTGREIRYPLDPAGFAALALRLAPMVATVSGCCGTTPEHIAAAHELSLPSSRSCT